MFCVLILLMGILNFKPKRLYGLEKNMAKISQLATADELGRFWTERLKGAAHTAWGDQARQLLLSDAVYRGVLGLRLGAEILPATERR